MVNDMQNRQDRRDSGSTQSELNTIEQYPLERRKIAKKVTVAMIFWTIFLGMVMIFLLFLAIKVSPWLWTLFYALVTLYVLVFIIQIWYQKLYFKRYYYNISADFLIIKKGVIMPHETMLPYQKLQDVYMDQDFFDRVFNLWDVHVSTATLMSGYEAHLDGVSHENAVKLRELILKKIRKQG